MTARFEIERAPGMLEISRLGNAGRTRLAELASVSPLLTEESRLVLYCAIAGLLGGSTGISAAFGLERHLRWPARLWLVVRGTVAGIATHEVFLLA